MLAVKIIWCMIMIFLKSIVYGIVCKKIFPNVIQNRLHLIVIGLITSWAVFYVFSVPLIFAKFTMNSMTLIMCAITVGVILFVFLDRKKACFFLNGKLDKCKISKTEILLTVVLWVLIGMQMYGYIFLQHTDADDAEFVAFATSAVQNNEMLTIQPLTGCVISESLFIKRAMNPFVILVAFYSKLTGIHPAIMSHTVLPPILLLFTYGVYWMISEKLFKNREERLTFLNFLAAIHIYGYTSVYTNSSFFLLRLWQGKAVLAALIIPFILYVCLCYTNENRKETIGMLFIAGVAGTLTSPISYVVIPIEVMTYFICQMLIKKRLFALGDGILACLPSLLCGVMFFVLMYLLGAI